jgi:DNA-directed RNA polymerase specialized sigma24 family protein
MTTADLSPSQVKDLMRLAAAVLSPWRDNGEFEDLLGEAYLGMWQEVRKLPAGSPWSMVKGYARTGAKWEALHYLRSRRTGRITGRPHFLKGLPEVPVLSLEEWCEGDGWDGGLPAAFDRVLGAQLWKWLLAHSPPREREAVLGYFVAGLKTPALGRAMGCRANCAANYIQRALSRCKKELARCD